MGAIGEGGVKVLEQDVLAHWPVSREQLAAKFESPVNTVKTWLRRSMMDIRECLGL